MNSLVSPAAADIDGMGHVNNSVYLRWVERAVHDHWRAMAQPSEFAAILWVAARHEVDYRRPALLGDQLNIDVRLDSVRRARAWYETIISRDGVTLVEAKSCWLSLDAETRTLIPIPRETDPHTRRKRHPIGSPRFCHNLLTC